MSNIILNTDSYKHSMFLQYPPKTTNVYSYIEARKSINNCNKILYLGMQGYLIEYLSKPFTKHDIDEAKHVLSLHGLPFNEEGWNYILNKHGGYLPLSIHSVDEGLCLPKRSVLATVENTDPKCYWLTTHIETSLLRAIWYPTTVGTISKQIKDLILLYLDKTGTPEEIDFKLHDFGARGVSSFESAGIGDMAHLVNFKGTDTISGMLYADKYYGSGIFAKSVPASEHSTMTSWGRNNEKLAYKNMLDKFAKPNRVVSIVSDSYNIYNAVEYIYGEQLKQQIIESNAILVIRPDSGNPVEVNLKLAKIIEAKFGCRINYKGYKVFNNIRLLQGDGINYNTINSILEAFRLNGYSADNIAFGMGGALLQEPNRDTLSFAMKCSAIKVDDCYIAVQKDPITDSSKRSHTGLVKTYKFNNEYQVLDSRLYSEENSIMNEVYHNGQILRYNKFDDIVINSNK